MAGKKINKKNIVTNLYSSMRKTLVFVWQNGAGISHLLDTPCPVEYVFRSQSFKLGGSERNRIGDKALLIPESHSAEVGR
jgi:hypothetical protein